MLKIFFERFYFILSLPSPLIARLKRDNIFFSFFFLSGLGRIKGVIAFRTRGFRSYLMEGLAL